MIKNRKIYFRYEGYAEHYGNTIRPALVRYAKTTRQEQYQYSADVKCTIFIDGKHTTEFLPGNPNFHNKPYSVSLLKPFHSSDERMANYNIEVNKFDPTSETDWRCIFLESYNQHKIGDPLAYALLAIAFDNFNWNNDTITNVIDSFGNNDLVNIMFEMINCFSWSLCPSKIQKIKELNAIYGKECTAIYPADIIELAHMFNVDIESRNLYSMVDKIFKLENISYENSSGFAFLRLRNWLDDENAVISIQDIQYCFPYLSVEHRNLVIKRFFLDVKTGLFNSDENLYNLFDNPQYCEYYSRLRYIFETWPRERDVSTDFLFDCLRTYKKTNENSFQVSDGILDWAMQKSIELQRPIDLKFNDWLCYCEGGVVIDKQFKGFANFECQYELDDFAFEEDSLLQNINQIRDNHAQRLSHQIQQVVTDKNTGNPIIDEITGEPKTKTITVWEDKWEVAPLSSERAKLETELEDTREALNAERTKYRNDHDIIRYYLEDIENLERLIAEHDELKERNKKQIDLFVNWDNRPDDSIDEYVFVPEMIDGSLLRTNIEHYLIDKYGTLSPYISVRKVDFIVMKFMYPVRMRATESNSARLGVSPGVEEPVIRERVKNRLCELFGDTLESDYNQKVLQTAQTDVQYRFDGEHDTCFIKSEKTYRGRNKIYCAPALSDYTNLLTGRKCAICGADMCFLTGIKKEPNWKNFRLIHILEILGYKVIDETEAGYIPNQVYNQFVNQINKAIKFYKRLTCRECGHILFPSQLKSHNKYKCMSPRCSEYNKEVYLNYCHKCKKGLIDSRDTKQCPNGLYICPDCGSCCSNSFFESMADRYRRQGKVLPAYLSSKIGKGHEDAGQVFCAKCGTEKKLMQMATGKFELRCPNCEPIPNKESGLKNINKEGDIE